MIYLSAGHVADKTSPKYDPGACANGVTEAELTKDLRELTRAYLEQNRAPLHIDNDKHSLVEMLKEVTSTNGDIICDIHFNAAANQSATGVEVIVPYRATQQERDLATIISDRFAKIMGIKNRGVKDETQSQHRTLAVMKPNGTNILIEVCFISNPKDLNAYREKRMELASVLAELLMNADRVAA